MGDKVRAGARSRRGRAPRTGTVGAVARRRHARQEAASAVAYAEGGVGGSRRGMRIVERTRRWTPPPPATSGGGAHFGAPDVYVERFSGPRHIELQVLVDRHGGVWRSASGTAPSSAVTRRSSWMTAAPAAGPGDAAERWTWRAAAARLRRPRHDRFLLAARRRPAPSSRWTPAAGRAPGDGDGDGHRHRRQADPHRRREQVSIGRRDVALPRPRDRVPDQRGRSGVLVRAVAGRDRRDWPPAGRQRRARRLRGSTAGGACRGGLRPDDREAHRLRTATARGRDRADALGRSTSSRSRASRRSCRCTG